MATDIFLLDRCPLISRLPKIGRQVLPFLIYVALAITLSWPMIMKLSTHLPDGTDTLVHYWNGWMSWQALKSGETPYFTQLLFFPNGLSMVFNNFAWLHIAGWILLQPVLGGVAAYNVVFLFNLAMCGVATYWLAVEVIGDRRVALLAGVVYQAWPHRLTQPSHPNLMSTWAIPIFLLFLIRAVKYRRWPDGVLAGLFLALVGYMRWQLLIGAVLVGGLYLALGLRKELNRRSAPVLALTSMVALLALLPPMALLATEMRRNPTDLVAASDESTVQSDLLAYVTPPSSHFLLGNLTTRLYETYYADRGGRSAISPYLGLATLFLIGLAAWKGPRGQTLPWLAISAVLFLLALGPVLRVGGRLVNIPMPYDMVQPLVFPLLLREPDRFNIFLALPVAILAGFGALHLRPNNDSKRRYERISLPAVAALILIEYLSIPMPLQSAQVSAVYSQLAAEPDDFAILNVPVDPFKSKPYMYAQTIHGHPIVQGHASRYPAGAFDYLHSQPWLESMMRFDQIPPAQDDISRQLAGLADAGIRFIVLHKAQIDPDYFDKWRHYLVMEPRFEDDDIVVYVTEPVADQDFSFDVELVPGLGIVDSQLSTTCLDPGAPLAAEITWGTSMPIKQKYGLQLTLSQVDGSSSQQQRFLIDDVPSSEWGANAIVQRDYVWQDPSGLIQGDYSLIAELLLDGEPTGRKVALGDVNVQDERCPFEVPAGATETNARFGDSLTLLGYTLEQEADILRLKLFWRGLRRMATEYKIFVHIFEPDGDGVPVVQNDSMPRNWGYPTTLWGLDELIDDDITLTLDGVTDGQYGVAVGVYDPISGERLLVTDGSGQVVPDGRLVLPSLVTLKN